MYRVAQIKIPHQTKCNFSTTVCDFYTQISWFIWERYCYNSEIFYKIILVTEAGGRLRVDAE